ncbi:5'-methylthioadenosine/S-adenosylhomocysteine nucleosidase [Bartonella sp. TP]|uniref:5'-methylthioadenosine/S-adenosylhomocysteine nucleosidase n=1 Tax=Bartonella sp. TP TaxID=3057550 RepID=UPI0025B1836C|nr:5'-methylthioadenosine/S-adenosylhomocysteine nucleosidase [Bartonella sp. TP]WJW80013.1 5'-methylthioadenosine/S-adenosylhomocysteine nucleosidase [Bartonella sp. TP]
MKIGFLFAMEEEAKVLEKLASFQPWQLYHDFKITEFLHENHEIIALICGIGKSFSAAGAMLLLEKYKPDIIINIGLAGGIKCQVGDIVLSQSALFHDVDLSTFGNKKNQLASMPLVFTSAKKSINLKSFIQNLHRQDLASSKISEAMVISGDQFIDNAAYVAQLSSNYPEVMAVEMEAASIGAICHRWPCEFLFIKKISDLADEDATESFTDQVHKVESVLAEIIQALLAQLA